MALLADAGHNLSDVLSLLLAWGASVLARRRPSQRFTYGLRSTSILAALINAVRLGDIGHGGQVRRRREPETWRGSRWSPHDIGRCISVHSTAAFLL